jgi:hypothetical protein
VTSPSVSRVSLIAALLGAVSLGCSSHRRNEDFVPAEQTARGALESYLNAWKQGNMDQAVPGTRPVVMSGDSLHAAKRPLKEFTILGPVAADAERCYAVRLVLDEPREERRERYVIIGLDPLWVMLYDDYEMLTHWCNEPPTNRRPTNKSSSPNK